MAGAKRTAEEITAFLERRVKLYELAASNARTLEFKDRCNAVALHCRAVIDYAAGGSEALTDSLNPERWVGQVKRSF